MYNFSSNFFFFFFRNYLFVGSNLFDSIFPIEVKIEDEDITKLSAIGCDSDDKLSIQFGKYFYYCILTFSI